MDFTLEGKAEDDIFREEVSEVTESAREIIRGKLREHFDGKIVRKDLKKIKEGANVPVYVLEFLLGQYCSSDNEEIIENGIQSVKRILADNFVRPDEAQKILSKLRSQGSHTVIDSLTVRLDIKKDIYVANFSNLGLPMCQLPMNTRRSTIACSVVAFGALSNWNMSSWKRKRPMGILYKSGNLHPSRCHTSKCRN